jgi:hypothetical protein
MCQRVQLRVTLGCSTRVLTIVKRSGSKGCMCGYRGNVSPLSSTWPDRAALAASRHAALDIDATSGHTLRDAGDAIGSSHRTSSPHTAAPTISESHSRTGSHPHTHSLPLSYTGGALLTPALLVMCLVHGKAHPGGGSIVVV